MILEKRSKSLSEAGKTRKAAENAEKRCKHASKMQKVIFEHFLRDKRRKKHIFHVNFSTN